jgi:uncharacterized protein YfaP (DUF2135 family)
LRFRASVTYAVGGTYTAEQTLKIDVVGSGEGSIEGQVIHATTGNPLPDVTITIDDLNLSTQTDANGEYSFVQIPSGSYAVSAAKAGHAEVSASVTVFDDKKTIHNISLPLISNPTDMVITLSWGETPLDLDSHLWLPETNSYHIFFLDKGSLTSGPHAQLDVDDITSYGPENVTIRRQVNGRYIYAVHNFSGSPSLTTSSATVTVVMNGRLVQTFNVPTSGSGLWWYVFDYDADTGNIIPRNILTNENPGEN